MKPLRVLDAYCRAGGVGFDYKHASPPCQEAHPLTNGTNIATGWGLGDAHPQLIPATREALLEVGGPWDIENTDGGPIRHDLRLVGDMFRTEDGEFELGVWRRRWFELHGVSVPQPAGPSKPSRGRVAGFRHGQWFTGPYFAVYGDGGGKGSVEQWQAAMGIDWTADRKHLAEAVPPAYARYLGLHVFPQVLAARLEVAS